MSDNVDYTDDSIFPTRGVIPELDKVRDRKIREQLGIPVKIESEIAPGSVNRLERVKELKHYDNDKDALDFCISMGWLIAENQAKHKGH